MRSENNTLKNRNEVLVGSIVQLNDTVGVENLKRFLKYNLGNYVVLKIHWIGKNTLSLSTILDAVEMCVKNKLRFSITEYLDRYTLEPYAYLAHIGIDGWAKIQEAAGDYLISNWTVCERGGCVYWPRWYKTGNALMERAERMEEARDLYIESLRTAVERERSFGRRSIECVDSSLLQKYSFQAGVDLISIEVFPGDCDLMFSAVRGATRAYERKGFGSDIAMVWYGGVGHDELWLKRWKCSLLQSFIAGSDRIFSETGDFGINVLGKKHSIDSSLCRRYRGILSDFHAFAKYAARPSGGPKTKMAIISGHLDGAPGLWNKEVWGQYQDEKWLESGPERSWRLFSEFFKKPNWFDPYRTGDVDHTGNPPYGQIDILPVEAPLRVFQKYSCVMFLGWNTMNDEIYDKLIKYVSGGGRLFMNLGHLNSNTDRGGERKLHNDGALEELFGVKVSSEKIDRSHCGIKFVADAAFRNYKFPNWTENQDPKWIDVHIPTTKVTLKGARELAHVSPVFCESQLGRYNKKLKTSTALTEFKLGKGYAYLITLPGYPGDTGVEEFQKEIIRTVAVGEHPKELKVIASDRVRYAVYENDDKRVAYFLNTEFDLSQHAEIIQGEEKKTISIPPISIKKVILK
jgi:hypothetical protein